MKEVKTTISKKNPYRYNGESTHISPQKNQSLSTDTEGVMKNKKVYIESYGCP